MVRAAATGRQHVGAVAQHAGHAVAASAQRAVAVVVQDGETV